MALENLAFETASFRGLPFHIRGDGHSGSHKLISHQYFVELGDTEDRAHYSNENTGTSPETHQIQGYVHAPNLAQKRRDLMEAFRDRTPGTLYHPFYNEQIQVSVSSWNFSPTKDRQGIVEFTLSVVPEGSERAPRQTQTPLARLPAASAAMEDAAVSDFEKNYDLSGAQGTAASGVVNDWNNALDFIRQTLTGNFSPGIGEIINQIDDARSAILDGSHGSILRDALNELAFFYDFDDQQGAAVFSRLVNMGLALQPTGSQQAAIQNNNTIAMTALVNRLSLSHFAGFAINTDYDNQTEAHLRRSEFASAVLDEQLRSSELGDTASYIAASDLLALTGSEFEGITDVLQPLAIDDGARLGTALSLSWKYYRDPERALELMERNFVLNGSFMPPSVIYVTT